MSQYLKAELAGTRHLPETALRLLAKDPSVHSEIVKRVEIPEDLWFEIWNKSSSDRFVRQMLVHRYLTPEQVQTCMEKVLSCTSTAEKFLEFNTLPPEYVKEFKRSFDFYLREHTKLRELLFLGPSIPLAESKRDLMRADPDSDRRSRNLLAWYAFRAGEETSDTEIANFIIKLSAQIENKPNDRHALVVTSYAFYLFSRRPGVATHLRVSNFIATSLQGAIISTEALRFIEASTLNKWFKNAGLHQSKLRSKYLNAALPDAVGFKPGQVPADFRDRIPKHTRGISSGMLTVQALEMFASSSKPKSFYRTSSFTGYSTGLAVLNTEDLSAKAVLAAAYRLSIYGNDVNIFSGDRSGSDYEDDHIAEHGYSLTAYELQSEKTELDSSVFFFGLCLALKDADVSTWETFIALGENYQGSLEKMLKTLEVLS